MWLIRAWCDDGMFRERGSPDCAIISGRGNASDSVRTVTPTSRMWAVFIIMILHVIIGDITLHVFAERPEEVPP
jgi:hypothetical protein